MESQAPQFRNSEHYHINQDLYPLVQSRMAFPPTHISNVIFPIFYISKLQRLYSGFARNKLKTSEARYTWPIIAVRSPNNCFRGKNNKYYIFWDCVCSLRYPACKAYVLGPVEPHFSTFSQTAQFSDKSYGTQNVCFDFPRPLVWNISHSERKWGWYCHKCARVSMWSTVIPRLTKIIRYVITFVCRNLRYPKRDFP
jgi:hypothetical protein